MLNCSVISLFGGWKFCLQVSAVIWTVTTISICNWFLQLCIECMIPLENDWFYAFNINLVLLVDHYTFHSCLWFIGVCWTLIIKVDIMTRVFVCWVVDHNKGVCVLLIMIRVCAELLILLWTVRWLTLRQGPETVCSIWSHCSTCGMQPADWC